MSEHVTDLYENRKTPIQVLMAELDKISKLNRPNDVTIWLTSVAVSNAYEFERMRIIDAFNSGLVNSVAVLNYEDGEDYYEKNYGN